MPKPSKARVAKQMKFLEAMKMLWEAGLLPHIEDNSKDTITSYPKVTRVEVIGNGREYVNMDAKNVQISFQDDERTIKIFIK